MIRLSALLAVLALSACASAPPDCRSCGDTGASPAPPALRAGATNVAILIFDGLFITEYVAPFDIYKHVGEKMNVFTVAPTRAPITTYEGVKLHPDYSFADAPAKVDVLVVPSGIRSTKEDLDNAALIGYVREKAKGAKYATSHCWGAFKLAKAGLLDGRNCTTFPTSIDDLQKQFAGVKTRKDARFVVDGNLVTSNGGLAAFEAALWVVEQMYGKETAKKVGDGLVFAPENFKFASDPRIGGGK